MLSNKLKKYAATTLLAGLLLFLVVTVASIGTTRMTPKAFAEKARSYTVHVVGEKMRGSGVYVGNSTVISAKHVCEGLVPRQDYVLSAKDSVMLPITGIVMHPQDDIDLCALIIEGTAEQLKPVKFAVSNVNLKEDIYVPSFAGGRNYSLRYGQLLAEQMITGIDSIFEMSIGTVMVEPGSSGGPVVNSNQELVGIVVWKMGFGGVGYIPLNTVKEFAVRIGAIAPTYKLGE